MCGICGIISFGPQNQANKQLISGMLDNLQHRGPDDQGVFSDEDVVLGHHRLSIIDLEGGRQPIPNEDRSVWAIVNGEIYNYSELRRRLENEHIFSTQSDSEIIVHLWEEFGPACVDYLRGMFAFAIYDVKRSEVFLARDRFGQKPLVYADTPHGFYFSSEIYPLTQIAHVDTSLNHRALDDFLSLSYIPAPDTIYKGIKKLQPAHTLTVSSDGATSSQYWSIDPLHKTKDSYDTAESKVYDLIKDSVRYRMIADVPVGAFSSGGVDSSIIIGFMREIEPVADIQTVCIGFDERGYDERPFARQVSKKFETTHHEHVLTPDVLGILPELVRHYGEPYGDPSAIPTWYLSQVTATHVKAALSGDGGDEMFAGYNRFDSTRLVEICQNLGFGHVESLANLVATNLPDIPWGEAYLSQLRHFLLGASQHPAERFILRHCVFTPKVKQDIYTTKSKEILHGYTPAERFFAAHRSLGRFSECEKLQQIDLRIFLPDDILAKVDIASMAHGLEVRSPFLDHKLAAYVFSLPFNYKYKIFRRKRILKSVGRQFFDANFLSRRKKGFGLPIGKWFTSSLKKPLEACLNSAPIFADHDIFDSAFIKQIFHEHQTGRINHTGRLWNLWFLGEWSKLMNQS